MFAISAAEQKIISVGIDIGTTTTQLVLSRLTVRNSAPASVIPHMEISEREVLYRSGIHFTPIDDHQLIDAEAVAQIIAEEYRQAGMNPWDVETGAVIKVPLFINIGDVLKVDTRTGEYLSRA